MDKTYDIIWNSSPCLWVFPALFYGHSRLGWRTLFASSPQLFCGFGSGPLIVLLLLDWLLSKATSPLVVDVFVSVPPL